MARNKKLLANLDWGTVFIYLILIFLGWINIYAATYNEQFKSIFDMNQMYGKQLFWIISAVVLGLFTLIVEARFFVFFSYPIYGLFLVLLIAVLLFGSVINGAKAWFVISGFNIQPAEFAKFATALALSKYISTFNFKMHRFRTLATILFIVGFPMVIIFLQHDTGTALIYIAFILVLYREGLSGIVLFFTLLVVLLFVLTLVLSDLSLIILMMSVTIVVFYFISQKIKEFGRVFLIVLVVSGIGIGLKYLWLHDVPVATVLIISSGLTALGFLFHIVRKRLNNYLLITLVFIGSLFFSLSVDFIFESVLKTHQQDRINEFLGIESDPLRAGYNVNQSKIAIGSGGFLGKGFLNGTQTKFDFVPEQGTDFIFCTVGEEWGFLGALVVIGLFGLLLYRLLYLAERQRSVFSRVYGYSVAAILFFHLMINIGMTIGLMPVIGIPLPFFSYGGSSLWSFTILLAIFLRLDAGRLELFA